MKIVFILLLTFGSALAQVPVINEVMSLNNSAHQDADNDYPDWIEIYNPGPSLNLNAYALSDSRDDLGKWTFPNIEIPSHGFLLIFASDKDRKTPYDLHTNFKITSKGETLFFSNPQGIIVDSLTVPPLAVDISYGRSPDGSSTWAFYNEPTPNTSNETEPATDYSASPQFSQTGGFYSASQQIDFSSGQSVDEIRYTTDGSDPNARSPKFSAPIAINQTMVLKARSFTLGKLPSKVVAHTYFINEPSSLPVVSLSTHPDNLFDPDIGIYVKGNGTAYGGYPDNPVGPPANYWEDWERPVHLELFEPDGRRGFAVKAGIKMFGKTTRKLPQKSFALFMRNDYGQEELNYPLFPDYPITRFNSFLLRNAGSDNTENEGGVHFRDGLSARLLYGINLDFQAYRPCHAYINGEYWGIYSLREKLNEDYLAHHHGVNPDNVDILDDYHTLYPLVVEGDAEDYNALIDYLKAHNLRNDAYARYVETQMDVDNYLTYMAVQIFFANHDGPGHNSKFWRPREEISRYRWLLYDTDHSFGQRLFIPNFHYAPDGYEDNTIAYYREENGPSWPNPPESTFMFRKMLENEDFRNRFINISADFLNTIFATETTLNIFKNVHDTISPEISKHLRRWGGSTIQWRRNTEVVETFLDLRPSYVQDHMIDEFNLGGLAAITLHVEPQGAGVVKLNSLYLDSHPWSGLYFLDVPIELIALPKPGYRFTGWQELDLQTPSATLLLEDDVTLTARFEESGSDESLVINEINYNAHADFDTEDWIELYNPLSTSLDVSGWTIVDDDTNEAFMFPANTIIEAEGFVVVCRDVNAFEEYWNVTTPVYGPLSFGLNNNGDTIILRNAEGMVIDSLSFQNTSPWPRQPDGHGATLALRYPFLDNSDPQHWMASFGFGTPGYPNQVIGDVETKASAPNNFGLSSIYPNPFNSSTTIRFSLNHPGHAQLRVIDILGRHVRTLLNSDLQSGTFEFVWDGRDDAGSQVSSGIYIVVCQSDTRQSVRKVALVE